ncbi:hypothetical protein Aple_061560 [Acrocarpospora pleiomorpha]|uniref:Uncharacterized protein n=1 Tax=Acrocarpospora pleiomorpha TaxID=90975 RepID=A0A5M3XPH1_9ACTN|nr:hypothetical protein Aple_061560 [Acrocarpospora pleiomorpha]
MPGVAVPSTVGSAADNARGEGGLVLTPATPAGALHAAVSRTSASVPDRMISTCVTVSKLFLSFVTDQHVDSD